MRTILALATAVVLALAGAPAEGRERPPDARARWHARLAGSAAAAPAAANTIMGAGDISPDPASSSTADYGTSELLLRADPRTVFTLGDNQYYAGTLANFTSPTGYRASWGRVRAKTCAVVGNHDYLDPAPGPAGFLEYFEPICHHRIDRGPYPTVYAFRPAPGWWMYVLDSQCTHAEERGPDCGRYGPMLNWYRSHMAAHPTRCRIAAWHHPRWGNGAPWGDDATVEWLWRVAAHRDRTSIVLGGHSHSYERFTSMTELGAVDTSFRGPRMFTVGTGGAPLIGFSRPPRVGTRFRAATHHGVLRLILYPNSWASEFDRANGEVVDRVGAGC